MSKANSPKKVLRVALKRLDKGWTKGHWSTRNADGSRSVCLEGAIFGFCRAAQTDAQRTALAAVEEALRERQASVTSIPAFNDDVDTTLDDVKEVVKMGLIKLETGWQPHEPLVLEKE